MVNEKLNDILNEVTKGLAKDPNVQVYEAGDIRITSFVPHGIPTRQPMLDLTIGKDGIPVGKIVELYGWPGCGKTTAAYHIIAQTQKLGGAALFIDTEQSFDLARAVECGCTEANLHIASVGSTDGIFRTIMKYVEAFEKKGFSKDFVIVVDSISAVSPEMNLALDAGDHGRPGEEARAIRNGLKQIVPRLANLKIPCIMINHLIKKIGVSFGSDEMSAGGYAVKYYAAFRCKFTRIGEAFEGKKADNVRLGHRLKVVVEKLKGTQQKRFNFDTKLLNDGGFDSNGQLLEAFVEIGKIKDLGRRRYCLLDSETQAEVEGFHETDWPKMVDDMGGFDFVYDKFLNEAVEVGRLERWGAS